jgi:mannose-6-phosphate isomerase-like protein (cupin superfamily)
MKIEKPWGYYFVLYFRDNVKVKELFVNPHSKLSMQRHNYRAEHWHVAEGVATVNGIDNHGNFFTNDFNKNKSLEIGLGDWHQLENKTNDWLRVIEIQYGEKCEEEDIERNNDY